jgi:hypothetical protein
MSTSNKINWVVALVGIWEGLAPFILGYSDIAAAVWNAIIVGLIVLVLAVWSALTDSPTTAKTLDWINVAVGIWLIIAPFVLGYSIVTIAMWNAIIVGAVIAALEIWAALSIRTVETVDYE